ncbi:MAG: carboxypeptidase-like regulatory domain-containing protein [Saprospiraceae bacterium]|nr:carboxypeptidase-like regulatory domain-containing protein [Saprospiraceae bacterium]MCB0624251.1 carboxypeptidase-like regulatory domain-containing protein [Saprospiraceae bacterium]MCB0678977.1 carboxypeptidase-like regulatory domain-containing protein [Saprospiraceae bacterium]MCB0679939.1 carboxypeptidase-like regulatory domain-containing protein [Saprospiraceae bacterium]
MKTRIFLFFFGCFSIFAQLASAQKSDTDLIQFSGMVLDGTDEQLIPVPYTNVLVKGEGRGTYSDFSGFFSIVLRKGDVVEFSAVGYKTVDFQIPDSLTDNRYSLVQLMTRDTFNLPTAVIFPWPSREHFKLEFLAMDVSSEMQQRAVENIAQENLSRMRNDVRMDGNENADYYLRKQASSYYYIGQTPPMNIFNPIAWKQFFDAWKRGDFKKK